MTEHMFVTGLDGLGSPTLEGLNDEQGAAVTHNGGPLLVLAGPGLARRQRFAAGSPGWSGKVFLLTAFFFRCSPGMLRGRCWPEHRQHVEHGHRHRTFAWGRAHGADAKRRAAGHPSCRETDSTAGPRRSLGTHLHARRLAMLAKPT
jgi:hypothetical protein